MRLKMEPSDAVPTVATDGTRLMYNPAFVATLPDVELAGVMAHEVMHCALCHPYRRGNRDKALANRAMDYAINGELLNAGFQLPKDRLHDPKYAGLAWETIYAQLEQDEQQNPPPPQGGSGQQPQSGQGNGQQGLQQPGQALSTGTVTDAPAPQQQAPEAGKTGATQDVSQEMTAEDWKIASEQATAVSRAAGSDPGGASRAAKKARESREDWRATLREFIEHQMPSDYSWGSPNRRHIAQGLYLPGVTKENLGAIVVAVDTSGSISQRVLDCFASELTAIAHEARPERVDVIYCDSRIRHEESFSPDDPEITLAAHGGGGTRFSPVFAQVAERDEQPACLIYFTDLLCSDRPAEPGYPVLWVTGANVTREGPFGRTVRVDLYN